MIHLKELFLGVCTCAFPLQRTFVFIDLGQVGFGVDEQDAVAEFVFQCHRTKPLKVCPARSMIFSAQRRTLAFGRLLTCFTLMKSSTVFQISKQQPKVIAARFCVVSFRNTSSSLRLYARGVCTLTSFYGGRESWSDVAGSGDVSSTASVLTLEP